MPNSRSFATACTASAVRPSFINSVPRICNNTGSNSGGCSSSVFQSPNAVVA